MAFIFDELSITDNYYVLSNATESLHLPKTMAIMIDDGSGLLSFKGTASRKVIATCKKPD